MNREETIQVLLKVNNQTNQYLSKLSKTKKLEIVNEWVETLTNQPQNIVLKAVDIYFKSADRFPFPREILEIIDMTFENTTDTQVIPNIKIYLDNLEIKTLEYIEKILNGNIQYGKT